MANQIRDAKGLDLTLGDTVMVPCTITGISLESNRVGLQLQTLVTSTGGGQKSKISIDSDQVIRSNEGDKVELLTQVIGDQVRLK